MKGKGRFVAALKKFLPPGVEEPPPPDGDSAGEAWTEFKIRQLEARQQWLQRMLFLIVLAVLAEQIGLENVEKLLSLVP